MSVHTRPVVTVFGAGLAGALCAIRLARAGFRVELYERRPDPRVAGAAGGRSINLALSTRGIEALREMDLHEPVLADAILMRGRGIHPLRGERVFQPYSADPNKGIYSISRAGLNAILLDAAEKEPNVSIVFNTRCVGVDLDSMEATIEDQTTRERTTKRCEVVIGGDGAFSAVRSSMMKRDRFDYHQFYQTHGYKELEIPPAENESGEFGKFRIDPNALHIWPRRSYMMIALPNSNGSFTCTLFAPFEGEHGFESIRSDDDVTRYFEQRFPDAVPHMPDLLEDFRANPTSSLVTVRCFPWALGGRVALIGDAAHAVVPFYGQGMNASFEDVRVLGECVEKSPHDLGAAFAEYQARRKPAGDAISQLAIDNFLEMRDHVGSPAFRRKKKLELWLAKTFPRWYTPLYEMVTFSTIPYHLAVRKAAAQDRMVVAAFVALGAFAFFIVAATVVAFSV
ncbi:MAG: FAD-dependent monooxygenase [Phycisphaeraceae bacterium]|nr:FAD-dependent monooxygenase [Phycisphaeraceae bacterium]